LYKELSTFLSRYKDGKPGKHIFVVEGTSEHPIVAIRYPGRKLLKRRLKIRRANSIEWANLLDFEVVPYENDKISKHQFTYSKILEDFLTYKMHDPLFWDLLQELYYHNTLSKEPPALKGIPSKLFLLTLKWIWIQEDVNYKYSWQETMSPVPYVLQNRTGTTTRKGAGRAKFYAALLLLRSGFDYDTVRKIIPLY
jgi:hypothetical protein